MALTLPFGNYVARNTAVHRIDARIKLLLLVVYVFALFACNTWLGLIAALLILVIMFSIANIPLRLAFRGLTPVLFILLFTFIANTFTFSAIDAAAAAEQASAEATAVGNIAADAAQEAHFAEQATLLSLPLFGLNLSLDLPQSVPLIGSFGIRPLGAVKGLYFALRISLLVLVTSLLTYTSSVVSLTDAISKLLSPLRAIRVPVEDIAMVFTIALRFIPLTALEAERLKIAQSARGAQFSAGGLITRVKAWIPVMVPLFVNLFRRADYLAQAMESRCYTGKGRTQLVHAVIRSTDVFWAIGGSVLLVSIGLLL